MSRFPTRSQNRAFVKSFARARDSASIPNIQALRSYYHGEPSRWGHGTFNFETGYVPNNPAVPDLLGNEQLFHFPFDRPDSGSGFIFHYPPDQPEDKTFIANPGSIAYTTANFGPFGGGPAFWLPGFFADKTTSQIFKMRIRAWGLTPLCDAFSTPEAVTDSITVYKSHPMWFMREASDPKIAPFNHPFTGSTPGIVPVNSIPETESEVPNGLFFIDRIISCYCSKSPGMFIDGVNLILFADVPGNTLIREYPGPSGASSYFVRTRQRVDPNYLLSDPANPYGSPSTSGQRLFDSPTIMALSPIQREERISRSIGMVCQFLSVEPVGAVGPIEIQEITRTEISRVGSADV